MIVCFAEGVLLVTMPSNLNFFKKVVAKSIICFQYFGYCKDSGIGAHSLLGFEGQFPLVEPFTHFWPMSCSQSGFMIILVNRIRV